MARNAIDLIRQAQGTQFFGVGHYEGVGIVEAEFTPYDAMSAAPEQASNYSLSEAGRVSEIKMALRALALWHQTGPFVSGNAIKEGLWSQIPISDDWDDVTMDEMLLMLGREKPWLMMSGPSTPLWPEPFTVPGPSGPQPSMSTIGFLRDAVESRTDQRLPLFSTWFSTKGSAGSQVVPTGHTSPFPMPPPTATKQSLDTLALADAQLRAAWAAASAGGDEEYLAKMAQAIADARKNRYLAVLAAGGSAVPRTQPGPPPPKPPGDGMGLGGWLMLGLLGAGAVWAFKKKKRTASSEMR